jgi:glycosyltransferase involved in cell wall biosynthesis
MSARVTPILSGMARDLRVVHVVQALSLGGLERVAVTLASALAERGARVCVATSGGDALLPPLRAAGVTVDWIPRPKPGLGTIRAARSLATILELERPDVVHAWNPAAAMSAALARRLARLPETAVVSSYQGVPGRPIGRAARVFAATSDLVVALGPNAAAGLRQTLPAGRVVTIYNAVAAVPRRSPAEVRDEFNLNGEELVVTVGRCVQEKNQALLIDAVAELAPRRPKLRAFIVGEGPLESELRSRIAERGLDAVARLTGPRLDAVDIVAAADVFALSSSYEALGVVLLAAMSVGCPVAATAVGGVPDVVEDGRTGLLVPSGDARRLAGAIERLLDDRTLRESVTAGGRELIERKFSTETMVDRFEAAYESAVARRRAR